MTLKDRLKLGILYSPGDPAGGAPSDDPIEPEQTPSYDFSDPVLQAEIARQAQEHGNTIAESQFNEWKQNFNRYNAPQPNAPQLPNMPKDPLQIRAERIQAILANEDYNQQIAGIVDLMDQSAQATEKRIMENISPLIRHSATQSATTTVLRNAKDVPVEARPFIEETIDAHGFSPKDLENPANAQLVADAAYARAIRAGKIGQPAPTPQQNILNNAQRTPVSTPAPVSTPSSTAGWRSGLTQDQQAEMERTISLYTPPGVAPEQAFDDKTLGEMAQQIKYRDSLPTFAL